MCYPICIPYVTAIILFVKSCHKVNQTLKTVGEKHISYSFSLSPSHVDPKGGPGSSSSFFFPGKEKDGQISWSRVRTCCAVLQGGVEVRDGGWLVAGRQLSEID